MPIKKYESLFHEDYLQVTLSSGIIVKVAFKGGGEYPKPHGGCYVTDDKVIQDALEARKDFNQKFKIILIVPTKSELADKLQKITPPVPPEIDIPDNRTLSESTLPPVDESIPEPPVDEPIPEPVVESASLPETEKESVKEENPGPTPIPEVLNFQQVRNYLCKTYPGTTFADVRSKESAKKFADEKKIFFPNWVE